MNPSTVVEVPLWTFIVTALVTLFVVLQVGSVCYERGRKAGVESERDRVLGPETPLQSLAVRLHNARNPGAKVERYRDIGESDWPGLLGEQERRREAWLKVARECQAAHETEGGAS